MFQKHFQHGKAGPGRGRKSRFWRMAALCALLSLAVPGGLWGEDTGPFGGLVRGWEMRMHRALVARVAQDEARLAPFETDGCSGGLSHVWRLVSDRFPDFAEVHGDVPPWEGCCTVHDRAYHVGGSAMTARQSYEARLGADTALRRCVLETGVRREAELAARYDVDEARIAAAYGMIAGAVYVAVRMGGVPCSGLPWRWGFGWPGCSVLSSARSE